jgi:MFS family permease
MVKSKVKGSKGKAGGPKGHWYFRLLSSLYLATFLIRLSYGIITISFPDYTGIEENASFGLLWAAGPLAEIFTVLFVGNLIDKYGRRWALLMGLVAGAASNFLIACSTNYAILYAVTALHGAASGTILVASLALLADYVPIEHRGREIGMFDGVNLVGWGGGFLVGGLLKDHFADNLIWTFVISGILALIGCIYAYINLIEPDVGKHVVEKLTASRILSVIKQRTILLLVLPWFVIYMILGNFFAFIPKAGGQEFGIEGTHIGAVMAGATIAVVAFQRGYGALSDRIGRIKVMVIGVVGIVGLLMMFAVAYAVVPSFDPQPVEERIEFDSPADFTDGVFTVGNGTLQGGAITSLDDGQVMYVFGPIDFDDTRIHWIRPEWTGTNSSVSVQYEDEGVVRDRTLTSGTRLDLGAGPRNVTFLVTLGPGTGSSLSDLDMKVEHGPPPGDLVGEMLSRPYLIGAIALFGIMAGAFAPAALASLADESHVKRRGVTMSIYIVMIGLGQVVGPPITGWLMDMYGSKGFLYFLIGAGVCLMVIMAARWLDKRAKKRDDVGCRQPRPGAEEE